MRISSDIKGEAATSRVVRRPWLVLGWILVFCLVTRAGWVLHLENTDPSRTWSSDTWSYFQPAQYFAHAGEFPATMFLRTPGYPALLGVVFAIWNSETVFLVIQVFLSCVTVFACYWIAARLWGTTTGLVAAGITAVEPLQFVASGSLLTESVSSLALLAVVGLGFRVFSSRVGTSPIWSGLLGLVLAIAALIRPTVYYLPIFALVLLVVRALQYRSSRQLVVIAAFLIPIIGLLGGWQWRNHERVNTWRFSGIEAQNMAAYRAAGVIAWRDGIDLDTAQLRVAPNLEQPPRAARALGPYYDDLFERGTDIVVDDPVALMVITAKGLGAGVFGPGTNYVSNHLGLRSSRVVSVALVAWLLGLYSTLAIGIARVLIHDRKRLLGHLFAWGTVVYVLIASAGPETNARFRAPLTPILAIYAAYGLVTLVRCARVRRRYAPTS
jgi:4-amino-4-deoxy-L-arabinose transferase-like glycosyltransferase